MKRHSIHSGSCSSTSCVYRSSSKRASVQKLIRDGSKVDKLYYGKYLPLRERKLLEKLIRTRGVYDDVRNQLLSTSGSSDMSRSAHKMRRRDDNTLEKSSTVLKIVDLVDRGEIGSNTSKTSKLGSCCSCCECESLRKIKKYMEKHPPRKFTHHIPYEEIAKYCVEAQKRSKKRQNRLSTKISSKVRAVRFKVRSSMSVPCDCTLSLSTTKRSSRSHFSKDVAQKHHALKRRICDCSCKIAKKIKNIRRTTTKSSGSDMGQARVFRIKKDSIAMFREKLLKNRYLNDFECEPGTCIEEECTPEECLKKIKSRKGRAAKHVKIRQRFSGTEVETTDSRMQTTPDTDLGPVICECKPKSKSASSMTTLAKTKSSKSMSEFYSITTEEVKEKRHNHRHKKTYKTNEQKSKKSASKSKLDSIICECKPLVKTSSTITSSPITETTKQRPKTSKPRSKKYTSRAVVKPSVKSKLRNIICDCRIPKKSTAATVSIQEVDLVSRKQKPKKEAPAVVVKPSAKSKLRNIICECETPKELTISVISVPEGELILREPISKKSSPAKEGTLKGKSKFQRSKPLKESTPSTVTLFEPEVVSRPTKPRKSHTSKSKLRNIICECKKSASFGQERRKHRKHRREHYTHYETRANNESGESGKQAVKISSSFKFEIEFSKIRHPGLTNSQLVEHVKMNRERRQKPQYGKRKQNIKYKRKSSQASEISSKERGSEINSSMASQFLKHSASQTSGYNGKTVIPRQCESSICIPNECCNRKCDYYPYKSSKARSRSVFSSAGRLRRKSVGSSTSTRRSSKSRNIQSECYVPVCPNRRKVPPVLSAKREMRVINSQPHKQAVKISSNFSFNIEFYKETTPHTKTDHPYVKKELKPIKHHTSSQSRTSQSQKNQTGHRLKRCFCTLKMLQKQNYLVSHTISRKTMASFKEKKIIKVEKIKRTQTKPTKQPRILHECKCISTEGKYKPCDCAETNTVNVKKRSTPTLTSQELSDRYDRRKHQHTPKPETVQLSETSQKQAVRVGSSFSFDVEFSKTNISQRSPIQNEPSSRIRKENKQIKYKGINFHRPCVCNVVTGTPKPMQQKKSSITPFLHKCLCTMFNKNSKKTAKVTSSSRNDDFVNMDNKAVTTKADYKRYIESCECRPHEYKEMRGVNYKYPKTSSRTTRSTLSGTPKTMISSGSQNTSKISRGSRERTRNAKSSSRQMRHNGDTPTPSDRQAVRIGSNFSFKIEFCKESPAIETEDSRLKREKNKRGSEHKHSKRKTIGMQPSYHHLRPNIDECQCTLKFNKKGKNERFQETNMKNSKSTNVSNKPANPLLCECKSTKTSSKLVKPQICECKCTSTKKIHSKSSSTQMRHYDDTPTPSDRQAVRIESNFSFKIEFYKESPTIETEDSRLKREKTKRGSKHKHPKLKTIGMQPSYHHLHPAIDECLCSLKFNKKGKNERLQDPNMKNSKSTNVSNKPANPLLCECKSTKTSSKLVKPEICECKCTSTKKSKQEQEMKPRGLQLSMHGKKRQSVNSITTQISVSSKSKHTQYKLDKQVSKQDPPEKRSSFSPSQPAVQIGSNFKFNVEFFKETFDEPSSTTIKKVKSKGVSKRGLSQPSDVLNKEKNGSNVGIILKRCFRTLGLKKKDNIGGNQPIITQFAQCVHDNQFRAQNKLEIKKGTRKSKTSALNKTLWNKKYLELLQNTSFISSEKTSSSSTITASYRSRFEFNSNKDDNTESSNYTSYSEYDKYHHGYSLNDKRKNNPFYQSFYALNVQVSQLKNFHRLKDDECETGICIPYECDPIKCLDIIKRRRKHSKLAATDRPKTKSVQSVNVQKKPGHKHKSTKHSQGIRHTNSQITTVSHKPCFCPVKVQGKSDDQIKRKRGSKEAGRPAKLVKDDKYDKNLSNQEKIFTHASGTDYPKHKSTSSIVKKNKKFETKSVPSRQDRLLPPQPKKRLTFSRNNTQAMFRRPGIEKSILKQPKRHTVRFGSKVNFNMELFKGEHSNSSNFPTSTSSDTKDTQLPKGSGDTKMKTKNQSGRTKDAGNNFANVLNRCFCTSKHAKYSPKADKKVQKAKAGQSTPKLASVGTISDRKSDPNACEPGSCVPSKCEARKCEILIKKRHLRSKNTQVQQEKQAKVVKSVVMDKATGTKGKRISKSFECEPYVCKPDNCDPYACMKRMKAQGIVVPEIGKKVDKKSKAVNTEKKTNTLIKKCICVFNSIKSKQSKSKPEPKPKGKPEPKSKTAKPEPKGKPVPEIKAKSKPEPKVKPGPKSKPKPEPKPKGKPAPKTKSKPEPKPKLKPTPKKADAKKKTSLNKVIGNCFCTLFMKDKKGKISLAAKPSKHAIVKENQPTLKLEKKKKETKQEKEMETLMPYSKKKFKKHESKEKIKPVSNTPSCTCSHYECRENVSVKTHKKNKKSFLCQRCQVRENAKFNSEKKKEDKKMHGPKNKNKVLAQDTSELCPCCHALGSAKTKKQKKKQPTYDMSDVCPYCQNLMNKTLNAEKSIVNVAENKPKAKKSKKKLGKNNKDTNLCQQCLIRELAPLTDDKKVELKPKPKKNNEHEDPSHLCPNCQAHEINVSSDIEQDLGGCICCKCLSMQQPIPKSQPKWKLKLKCLTKAKQQGVAKQHVGCCSGNVIPEQQPTTDTDDIGPYDRPLFEMLVNKSDMNIINRQEVLTKLGTKGRETQLMKEAKKAVKLGRVGHPQMEVLIDNGMANVINSEEVISKVVAADRKNKSKARSARAVETHKTPIKHTKSERHDPNCVLCCACRKKGRLPIIMHPDDATGDGHKNGPKGVTGECHKKCAKGVTGECHKKDSTGVADDDHEIGLKPGDGKKKGSKAGDGKKKGSKPGDGKKKGSKPGEGKKKGEKPRKFKPCVCGSVVCKKKWDTLKRDATDQDDFKVKTCVCGTDICLQESRKLAHMLETNKDKLRKAKDKKHKKLLLDNKIQKERKRRVKLYAAEDAKRWKRRKKQDKRDMKFLKNNNLPDILAVTESLTDLGKLSFKALCDLMRTSYRVMRHPGDGVEQVKHAIKDPHKAKKGLHGCCERTGFFSAMSRIKRRLTRMDVTKSVVTRMESHPVTNFILHLPDKDPKRRLKKIRKKRVREENMDFECNLFMSSLRKRPCLRVYQMCPWFYPHCISLLGVWKQFTEVILFILAVGVWCPCILCMELSRAMVCCCLCTG